MYRFNQPTTKVVNSILRTVKAMSATDTRQHSLYFDLYTANVAYAIGKLTVTYGCNEYNERWVTVKAERLDDLGRNNTVGVDDLTPAGLALAIGFTCGSAFWRATLYR